LVELNNLDVTQSQWEAKVKALKLADSPLKRRGGRAFLRRTRLKAAYRSVFAEKARALKEDFLVKDSNGGRIAKRLTRVKG